MEDSLFPRAMSQVDALVRIFGECREGQIPRPLGRFKLDAPLLAAGSLTTVGYGYPNLVMGERYNGPGSPYWFLKTFAVLMLPDDHSFWRVKPSPLPDLEPQKALPFADMLIHRYPGHVSAFVPGKYSPAGHGQTLAKCGKFAYDTGFAF